jgi:integrase/recombinase XerD
MPKLMPFSGVKPDAWPPQLLRLLDLRRAPTGPLELPSVASSWRETTFNLHLWNVGYFVGWLKWSGRFQDTTDLYEYATAEVIGAYVDDMRGFGLSTRTIATRVDGVRASLAALSPSTSTDWLMQGINKLRDEPSDRRRTRQRSQHTARLVELGMDLMNQACRPGSNQRDATKAILYRDGLMIVFLALAVPRLSPLQVMALGQHLVAHDSAFKISWSAKEMKEGKAYTAQLDTELSDLFQRYLAEFRPILLAQAGSDSAKAGAAVWVARDGGQLSRGGICRAIKKRTKLEFGESVFPHAFRHSAATSLALDRPDLIRIATPLLQHQSPTSRELYVLADEFEASRKFGEALDLRRFGRQHRRLRTRNAVIDDQTVDTDHEI